MTDGPTREQLEFHYRLERDLAERILRAPPAERVQVTLAAYEELFRRIPWHPGHLQTAEIRSLHEAGYGLFLRLAGRGHDILEIGCGGGEHLRELAPHNRRCVGIDIAAGSLASRETLPPNVELHLADAVDLSLFPDQSFDYVFSKQLLEHLHPDDLPQHLREAWRVLRPGGRYVFETPTSVTGPHDISRHFDTTATGLHLREYRFGTLLPLLRAAGFMEVRSPLFRDRIYRLSPRLAALAEIPAAWKLPGEAIALRLPRGSVRRLAALLFRLNLFVIARR